MPSLVIGIGALMAVLFVSYSIQDWSLFPKLSGAFGLVLWLAAGILNGSFVSGDRVRANFQTRDKIDIKRRLDIAKSLFFIGLPNILTVLLYSLNKI